MKYTVIRSIRFLLAGAGLGLWVGLTPAASAQSTFTYQGLLEDAGGPVDGTQPIRFRLFDAEVGGNLFDETIVPVDIDNGLFSVELDFASLSTIDPDSAWLEIAVGNQLETIGRQRLTAAPYSLNTRGINVDASGNVGIGTDNQEDILHISGNNARILTESTSGFFSGIRSRLGGSEYFTGTALMPGPVNGWQVFDNVMNARRLALVPNGNFGIGVDQPAARLHVNGGGLFSGNVGIGTTSPSRPLVVRGTSSWMLGLEGPTNPGVRIAADNAAALGTSWAMYQDSTSGDLLFRDSFDAQNRLSIDSDTGGVGISGALSLADNSHSIGSVSNPDVALFIQTAKQFGLIVNTGLAAKPGGGSWTNASDERLKTNIQELDGALDTMLALKGVTYEYKDAEAINELPGERIGFIAQDVEAVIPDWIDEGDDGYKRMTIRGFEAMTVEAFREQQEQIAALQSEIESLKGGSPVMGASMAWPMLIGGGLMGGIVVVRRRMSNS